MVATIAAGSSRRPWRRGKAPPPWPGRPRRRPPRRTFPPSPPVVSGRGSLVRERWSGRRVASCDFTVSEKLLPSDLHRSSESTKAGESRAMQTGRGDRHHTDERAGGADWTPPAPEVRLAPKPSRQRGE